MRLAYEKIIGFNGFPYAHEGKNPGYGVGKVTENFDRHFIAMEPLQENTIRVKGLFDPLKGFLGQKRPYPGGPGIGRFAYDNIVFLIVKRQEILGIIDN